MKAVRNNKGFTLIEIAIAMALVAVLLAGGYSLLFTGKNLQNKSQAMFWLTTLRGDIIAAVKNKDGFEATALDATNAAMNCIKQKIQTPTAIISCADQTGPVPKVFDKNKKIVVDTSSPSAGWDINGIACDTFDATNGNNECPFRYEVSWKALCADEGCSSPDHIFKGELKVAFKRKDISINPITYGFNIFLPGPGEKNVTTCEQSLLGNYTPADKTCYLKMRESCPTGQFVIGFNGDGSPRCKVVANPVKGSCTGDLRLRGVDGDGNPICVNWCI